MEKYYVSDKISIPHAHVTENLCNCNTKYKSVKSWWDIYKITGYQLFSRSTQTHLPHTLHKGMFIPTIKVPQIVHIYWKKHKLTPKKNWYPSELVHNSETLLNISISEIYFSQK